jgi:hypothetical protein
MPTNALTTVEIAAAMTFFTELTADEFLADASAVMAFRAALASSAGVVVDAVAVLSAAARTSARRQLLTADLDVGYTISLQLRGTAGGDVAAKADTAAAAVKNKVWTAITDGSYATALKRSLLAEGDEADLYTVDADASAAAALAAEVTMAIASPAPTPRIEPAPTPRIECADATDCPDTMTCAAVAPARRALRFGHAASTSYCVPALGE